MPTIEEQLQQFAETLRQQAVAADGEALLACTAFVAGPDQFGEYMEGFFRRAQDGVQASYEHLRDEQDSTGGDSEASG